MQLERRVLVACFASLSVAVLGFVSAEHRAGKSDLLARSCCRADPEPAGAAALFGAGCSRRDASRPLSPSTNVAADDSALAEDDTDEGREEIAMGGGRLLVVVCRELSAALDVDFSEARIHWSTGVGSFPAFGVVDSADRVGQDQRPSAVALGPSTNGLKDAPQRRVRRPEPQRHAGAGDTALLPPTPGEASTRWLVVLGCDAPRGLDSVTVLGLTAPTDTCPGHPGTCPPVVLATQAASLLAMDDWPTATPGPALELLVGAPGYAWQRVRVEVEEQEDKLVVVLQRYGDVEVAGGRRGPLVAADLGQVGIE